MHSTAPVRWSVSPGWAWTGSGGCTPRIGHLAESQVRLLADVCPTRWRYHGSKVTQTGAWPKVLREMHLSKGRPARADRGMEMQLQKQQSTLLERMYGSVDAARDAWAEQEQRSRARESARAYCL
jgi:hypothetical protein